jgi:phosphoglycolate phosphatase
VPAIPTTLRAVLFDFDGTLGDSYPAITASVNHVRAMYGLPPMTEEQVRPHVGHGPDQLLQGTVGQGSTAANVAAYLAHHPSVMHEGTRLMPGAAEALSALRGRGLRLAVCSNKPVAFTRDLLAYLGVADRFEVVLGPEDVLRPKPAPDMLGEALRRLAVRAADALYVGDMDVDIQTGRAAGVTVWVVATGSDTPAVLEAAKPDGLFFSLAEMARAVIASFP